MSNPQLQPPTTPKSLTLSSPLMELVRTGDSLVTRSCLISSSRLEKVWLWFRRSLWMRAACTVLPLYRVSSYDVLSFVSKLLVLWPVNSLLPSPLPPLLPLLAWISVPNIWLTSLLPKSLHRGPPTLHRPRQRWRPILPSPLRRLQSSRSINLVRSTRLNPLVKSILPAFVTTLFLVVGDNLRMREKVSGWHEYLGASFFGFRYLGEGAGIHRALKGDGKKSSPLQME